MKKVFLVVSFVLLLDGAFGDIGKVSVKEGDCLSLQTDVTEIQKIFLLMWMYESQNNIIAKIDGTTQAVSLYDVDDGRFEDRLQLDNQTGSLSVRDIRTKHSGDYHLKILSNETFLKTFTVTVHDVIFAGLENKKEGDSVTLHTGVTASQKHDLIQWTFGPVNPETLLAEMNIKIHEITFSPDDIRRERLHLENQTGSLTIRDVRPEDAGVYQLQISNSKETLYKRFSVFVAGPDPGLSAGYIVLICLCIILLVAAALGVMCYMLKYSKKRKEKKAVSEKEGNSVTLKTGALEIKRDDEVLWMFGPQEMVVAQIHKNASNISYTSDERFRDKLQLDSQTGDLTISDIRIPNSGDYQMKITGSKARKTKRFKVVLREDTRKFTEGEIVHLQTGLTEIQKDDEILWNFEPKNALIARIDGQTNNKTIYDVGGDRFGNRLELDDRTGNLTITNTRSTDSGVYELQIKSRNKVSYKKFNVLVWLNNLKYTVGDSVTLRTGVALNEDKRILWKFSDKNTFIAEVNRATNETKLYDGPDGRFRDRLQLNQRNGDLTIRNISRAHSDVYTLQITSGTNSTCKRFMVIAHEKTESGTEGGSVVLHNDTEIQDDDLVLWTFGPEDALIARGEIHKASFSTYDGTEGKFRNKLNLDHETGSLTITNSTTQHTGVYKLLIISSRETKYKRFKVTVQRSERSPDGGPEQEGTPLIQIIHNRA